jgi:hypothetical protein
MSLDQVLLDEGCCDGGKCHPTPEELEAGWREITQASASKYAERLTGDSLLTASDIHPTSQEYFDLLDTLRELHLSKSAGYGCPDGTDPLLNIRNGAKFVGISPWRAALVRFSDKVTRLATFCKTGTLSHESVEDNLLDAASYALLALLLYRKEQGK